MFLRCSHHVLQSLSINANLLSIYVSHMAMMLAPWIEMVMIMPLPLRKGYLKWKKGLKGLQNSFLLFECRFVINLRSILSLCPFFYIFISHLSDFFAFTFPSRSLWLQQSKNLNKLKKKSKSSLFSSISHKFNTIMSRNGHEYGTWNWLKMLMPSHHQKFTSDQPKCLKSFLILFLFLFLSLRNGESFVFRFLSRFRF